MNTCSLFQVEITDEQINKWFPLKCNINNPKNCGPTALALTNVIPKQKAQEVSKNVELTGIDLVYFTKLMLDYMPRYNIKLVSEQPINNIFDLIKTKLVPGNITIIGISTNLIQNNNIEHHSKHITTLAKNNNGDVILFDGQTQQTYINEDLINYLRNYTTFYYWCTEIKLKRKFNDIINSIIRKPNPETNGSSIKKQRIGGKSKKNRKYKKCKKTKRNKRNKNSKNRK